MTNSYILSKYLDSAIGGAVTIGVDVVKLMIEEDKRLRNELTLDLSTVNKRLSPDDLQYMDGQTVWVVDTSEDAFDSEYHTVNVGTQRLYDKNGRYWGFRSKEILIYNHKPC